MFIKWGTRVTTVDKSAPIEPPSFFLLAVSSTFQYCTIFLNIFKWFWAMILFVLEYFLFHSWWAWLRLVGYLSVTSFKRAITIYSASFSLTGCYCQQNWKISRTFYSFININLISTTQTIIHSGFAIWSLACGLISTITSKSHKVELVLFMLMAGAGAGQVGLRSSLSIIPALKLNFSSLIRLYKHPRLQHKPVSTEGICQSWPRSEMWV